MILADAGDFSQGDACVNMSLDSIMTSGAAEEPIQSTGWNAKYIGVLVIDSEGRLVDNYLVDSEQITADETSAAAIEAGKIKERVEEEYGMKIAESEVVFEGDSEVNRKQETNIGDLVTDALRWFIRKDPTALKVPEDHLVSMVNGGAIRAGIPMGDITKKDINKVYPFKNILTVTYLTGEELLEVLEASSFCTPVSVGGYPQTKGISLTIDTTKEYDRGNLYPGSTYYAPKSIQRVTINSINGKPFSPEDTYAVATTNYISDGGDTYFVFSMKEGFDTGLLIDELLIMYIQEELQGLLPASKYDRVRGDQEIILAEDTSGNGMI